MTWNPETTPNFSVAEMACKCGECGGLCDMRQSHMEKLQAMRNITGPLTVTSGYRCPLHPEEAKKQRFGAHAQGKATDIAIYNAAHRFKVIKAALDVGMVGLGIANSFVHVDSGHDNASRPASWVYGK